MTGLLRRAVFTLTLSCLASGLAHGTLVLGTLETEPQNPAANEPFELELSLSDPLDFAVVDAILVVEFRPSDQPNADPVSLRLREQTPGSYLGTAELPDAGSWHILIRDQTFRQEEAQATGLLEVGGTDNPESLSFVFPPTATGGQTTWSWILWLVGLPLVAGVLVTVLVLVRNNPLHTGETES